ncbi:signal recognition particle protein [Candidatus Nitrospira allomarina]|jgi:signal recognition particle subunit SRP54|uniref:Signal recognition particle protein n=1 Tax=Candidatus Nitrospira allomarina TaxID=3020900 RepID=A0AA96JS71_9BACT|nr:signal recognition particle protein [Candidatus Nitrospira allomarina]WNM58302.1 signal recognition particle protein [Candidatus Nitrospira allomarina]
MFISLTEKIEKVFKQLRGQAVLTEQNITDALKEVRLALLEADVNFKIVKDFIEKVRIKAVGQEVLKSLTPAHQVVKIVWEELRDLLGHEQSALHLSSQPPTVIMMVGLQGSGKTTTTGKLAHYFKTEGKRVLLVAADPRRPAAGDQLTSLGTDLDITVHRGTNEGQPGAQAVQTCRDGVTRGRDHGYDVVLLDTGGRLQIDEELMQELVDIQTGVKPQEVLLIADSMTGQEAVAVAERFNQALGLTGVILTKVEGDARGGAVLSIRAATGKPIKFLGIGEKLDALEPFYPDRMASRILGMGDVLTLIEKAQENFSEEQAVALQKKVSSNTLTLEDFRDQIKQVNKLGSFDQILDMLPGGQKIKTMMGSGAAGNAQVPEKEMKRVVAIIDSMTPRERRDHTILNGNRKKRVAKGSGTSVPEVNRLIKQFLDARRMMKSLVGGQMGMGKGKKRGKLIRRAIHAR